MRFRRTDHRPRRTVARGRRSAGERGPGSPGKDIPELARLAPAQGDSGPLGVAHDDPVVARLLGNDLADGGEVHDERAVAPEEGPGIEGGFELGERPRNEVAVSAGAREDEL